MRVLLIVLSLCASAVVLAQEHAKVSSPANASVKVLGEDGKSEALDAVTLAKMPQHEVHAEAHGKAVTCAGANLGDVVAKVGAPQGEALRGKALALFVRVSGRDGYQAVYSLAELDPAMHDNVPILTARCDGSALDEKDGPFRIVYPGEKRPARWVRQVLTVELLRAP